MEQEGKRLLIQEGMRASPHTATERDTSRSETEQLCGGVGPDAFVLNVVRDGYRLSFLSPPLLTRHPRVTPVPKEKGQRQTLDAKIAALLEKHMVVEVDLGTPGFQSTLFLVLQASGMETSYGPQTIKQSYRGYPLAYVY